MTQLLGATWIAATDASDNEVRPFSPGAFMEQCEITRPPYIKYTEPRQNTTQDNTHSLHESGAISELRGLMRRKVRIYVSDHHGVILFSSLIIVLINKAARYMPRFFDHS